MSRWSWMALAAVLVAVLILVPDDSIPGQAREITDPVLVLNPYQQVDWSSFAQHRANLHTHTTKSDGQLSPAQAIDGYHERGYSILALTDHDYIGATQLTWPWQDYGRDPSDLGILAIQGNELSNHHHLGSYYNDYGTQLRSNVERSLTEIGTRGGLAVFFHPGRYNPPHNWTWYANYYYRHPHLVGIEVYNQGDRYPQDRELWDNILTNLMPQRPVWGFSNDDMHQASHLGRNWNTLLLPKLGEEEVRAVLVLGQFYCTYQPGTIAAPVIKDISADETSINIEAENHTEILWISLGQVVHTGPTLNYKNTPGIGVYVRAQIEGGGGTTLTNPFGFDCGETPLDSNLSPVFALNQGPNYPSTHQGLLALVLAALALLAFWRLPAS